MTAKAAAEGDLAVTAKALAVDTAALADRHKDRCLINRVRN